MHLVSSKDVWITGSQGAFYLLESNVAHVGSSKGSSHLSEIITGTQPAKMASEQQQKGYKGSLLLI